MKPVYKLLYNVVAYMCVVTATQHSLPANSPTMTQVARHAVPEGCLGQENESCKLIDYYFAQYVLADVTSGVSVNTTAAAAQSLRFLPNDPSFLELSNVDINTMEPPDNYPKRFYCGTQRDSTRWKRWNTKEQDWRPAKPGDPNREHAFIFAIGDWGATTCPHENFEDYMTKCVRHIVRTRKQGYSWKDVYQNVGYLRCGSAHHECTFKDGLWGSTDCDPENERWWMHDFSQYNVANVMAKRAEELGGIDFVLAVGDNFYLRGIEDETDPNWRFMFEDVYHHDSLQVPWLSVMGNHDYGGHECDGCLFTGGTGGCTDGQIAYDNNHSWAFPDGKQKRWVAPNRYYMRRFAYTNFVIDVFGVDTNVKNIASLCHGQGKVTKDTCDASQCEKYFQDLHAEQRTWLKSELEKSDADWKFVFAHHPCEMWDQPDLKMMQDNGVSLVFAGHVHQQRLDKVGDIYCVITGAGGGYQWAGGAHATTIRHKGVPEYGFSMIDASKNQLVISYFNQNNERMWDDEVVAQKHPQIETTTTTIVPSVITTSTATTATITATTTTATATTITRTATTTTITMTVPVTTASTPTTTTIDMTTAKTSTSSTTILPTTTTTTSLITSSLAWGFSDWRTWALAIVILGIPIFFLIRFVVRRPQRRHQELFEEDEPEIELQGS